MNLEAEQELIILSNIQNKNTRKKEKKSPREVYQERLIYSSTKSFTMNKN